jgi:hypothetical protein
VRVKIFVELARRYAGGESTQARNAALYVSDVENGYLQAREPDGEFYSALALFKKLDSTSRRVFPE